MAEVTIIRVEELRCEPCKGESSVPVDLDNPYGPWGPCKNCDSTGFIEKETEITVEGTFSPGTSSYFDSSFGNYLPGDPPEGEITSAVDNDGNQITLTQAEEDEALEAIAVDQVGDYDDYDARAEDYYDEKY